jgi:hypothetical protein
MLVERRFIFCPKRCEFSRTVEEADEFLVPVSGYALADHRAVEDIQRGEHRGRAVPDIIVGHRPGPTLLHRQTRLGAVERDGKAERKDGTGHRFDRRGRPARRSQARASQRARASARP